MIFINNSACELEDDCSSTLSAASIVSIVLIVMGVVCLIIYAVARIHQRRQRAKHADQFDPTSQQHSMEKEIIESPQSSASTVTFASNDFSHDTTKLQHNSASSLSSGDTFLNTNTGAPTPAISVTHQFKTKVYDRKKGVEANDSISVGSTDTTVGHQNSTGYIVRAPNNNSSSATLHSIGSFQNGFVEVPLPEKVISRPIQNIV
ncbi:hypothetical protein DASC09_025450 [Saccharomycopsis crataegensis]|uniref:Uncharacterized protein n=1 Tax=Saccharomycopsis crataegensis TaxID=43959 RepID=A0AAV5QL18_9ASCO|nr:hypothetical protein DASC09_025450 [Saccharomycopsis crataegensis]